jgi:hypothetical protein
MDTTAAPETTTSDWQLWVPGAAVPVACFVADYLGNEPVSRLAPAGLPGLAVIGFAGLAISRCRWGGLAGQMAAGALRLVGVLTLALGILLALPSVMLLIVAFVEALPLPTANVRGLAAMLTLALLGLAPLWTGITYVRAARALTHARVSTGDRSGGGNVALGALAAGLMVAAAEITDIAIVDARLSALSPKAPATWEAAFQSLRAYPLCGHRCRVRTCEHLSRQFGETQSGDLNIPRALDDIFKRSFGISAISYCLSPG